MIRRTGLNKSTPSLVNAATSEHLNAIHAIRDDRPITDLTSVANSVNFDAAPDGSLVIRNPLVLKNRLAKQNFYIYDKQLIFTYSSPNVSFVWAEASKHQANPVLTFRYYDKNGILRDVQITNTFLSFFTNVYKHINSEDYSIFSARINRDVLSSKLNTYDFLYDDDILQYGTYLYRLFKIYKNVDGIEVLGTTPDYIIEMVNTELNSITSNMDVGNSESLDFNLLLDNPYAIRDLYNYGYNGTTKILAYKNIWTPEELEDETDGPTILELTEGKTTQGGLIESIDMNTLSSQIILKAFLTTAKPTGDDLKYYCIWEYSDNGGIDWKPILSFKDRFQDSIIKRYVSDLTSAEFEKKAYNASLEEAANYLVEKELVPFPINASVEDKLWKRPDTLIVDPEDAGLMYRFQVYVDTGKDSPVPEKFKSTATISYFEHTTSDFGNGKFEYSLLQGNSDNEPLLIPIVDGQESLTGHVRLYEGKNSKAGNGIAIKSKNDKYKITKVTIYTGSKSTINPEGSEQESYVVDEISKININSSYLTQNELKGTSLTGTEPEIKEREFKEFELSDEGVNGCTIYCADTAEHHSIRLTKLNVYFTIEGSEKITTTYLSSFTGTFQLKQDSKEPITLLKKLDNLRNSLFLGTFDLYENQIITYGKYNVFFSNVDSSIVKLSKALTFGLEVTRILPWRSYLLIFTEQTISIAKYDYVTDSYSIKLLTENIGISKEDARTAVVILNSIYFKSKYRVYKMIPNLYAATDDILNLHIVSTGIDTILEKVLSKGSSSNFGYADAEYYYIFVPTASSGTYCFKYQYEKKVWTVLNYPEVFTDITYNSITEVYLKSNSGIYEFNKDAKTLLNEYILSKVQYLGARNVLSENEHIDYLNLKGRVANVTNVGTETNPEYVIEESSSEILLGSSTTDNLTSALLLYEQCPYADYLTTTIQEVYDKLNASENINNYTTPIAFIIDFGQKSSNYTLDKQFLESKLIFATLQSKDIIPIVLDIETDGENMSMSNNKIHIDPNTSGALWRTNIQDKGTLNTIFGFDTNTNYDGIMRQLIVKYSGKGKTIRHVISGKTISKFKFYSLDNRYRILAKKQ